MDVRKELQKAREHPAVSSFPLTNEDPAPAQLWWWSLGWEKALGCVGPQPQRGFTGQNQYLYISPYK